MKDGVIDDPTRCTFSPAALRCAGPESDSCLTERQIATLQKLYAGPRTSRGEPVFPGLVPGGETGRGGWGLWVAAPAPDRSLQFAFASQAGPYLLHQDPSYSFRIFNVDRDVRFRNERVGLVLNAVNPDLSAFKRRGGKLILYHGWSDAALPLKPESHAVCLSGKGCLKCRVWEDVGRWWVNLGRTSGFPLVRE